MTRVRELTPEEVAALARILDVAVSASDLAEVTLRLNVAWSSLEQADGPIESGAIVEGRG